MFNFEKLKESHSARDELGSSGAISSEILAELARAPWAPRRQHGAVDPLPCATAGKSSGALPETRSAAAELDSTLTLPPQMLAEAALPTGLSLLGTLMDNRYEQDFEQLKG